MLDVQIAVSAPGVGGYRDRPAAPENGTPPAVPAAQPGAAESSPELHALVHALQAVREGDFSVRLPADWTGLAGKAADLFNDIVAANARLAQELIRVGEAVGKQGQTRQRLRASDGASDMPLPGKTRGPPGSPPRPAGAAG